MQVIVKLPSALAPPPAPPVKPVTTTLVLLETPLLYVQTTALVPESAVHVQKGTEVNSVAGIVRVHCPEPV